MYLCIIPGPHEPKLTKLNHYIWPFVTDLLISWEHGVCFSKTATHPLGWLTCSTVGPVVCDLPGAWKVSQTASISSHFYCTVCSCYHLSTLNHVDFEDLDWKPKDTANLQEKAEEWKNVLTEKDRENAFKLNGIDPVVRIMVITVFLFLFVLNQQFITWGSNAITS
jgi:hypothetical protein